ncbi:MAG: RnfABCDGE type electron transport complex subunit G [Muribaculaceae bacterium]|nr:RnfABCDGE type electron transport complex subunit G [Muribaculaceae bacterium]
MKKLKSTLPNMVIVLTVTTMGAGFLLGYVYRSTAEAREKAVNDKHVAAVTMVVTGFDNNPVAESTTVRVNGREYTIYPARKEGTLIGCAVESSSDNGFSGKITIVAGFDTDGKILGYDVTSHAETPGLGAKMGEWFRGEGSRSVIGRNPKATPLRVSKDGGNVDGITAATISSRAFLEALNAAADAADTYYRQFSK